MRKPSFRWDSSLTGIRKVLSITLGFVFLGAVGFGVYWLTVKIWTAFAALPQAVAVGILTAATTVLGSTVAIVAGRHYERKKELDALHRDKKVPIYDEFLKGVFDTFYRAEKKLEGGNESDEIINFIREWQRRIILWGGSDVVNAYIRWKKSLTSGPQTAQAVFRTEELFLAIRKELGHDNRRIAKGSFIGFILREPELFMGLASKNPNVKLTELAQAERELKK